MNGEARPGDEEAWEEEEYEWGQEDEDEEDELGGDWYGDFSVPAATGGAAGGRAKKKKKKQAKGLAAVRPLPARSASKVLEQHELAAVVGEWRMASRRSSAIDPKGCQEVLTLALAFLKHRYANHFPTTTSTPTPKKIVAHVALEKVDLVFARGGTEIQCQPATGKIEFGMETIKKEFYDGASSRYLLENDFMPKVCQTKEDALMWFLLHEFCHLFKGYERHSHTFFAKVLAMAQENMFLFSAK